MLGRITTLIAIFALVCSVGIFISGPLTRLGVWDFQQGLANIRLLAMPVLVGGALSLIMLLIGLVKSRSSVPIALIAVLSSAAAAYIPLSMKSAAQSHPIIHDITTDFIDPPAIKAAAKLPRKNPVAYVGDQSVPRSTSEVSIAEAQQKAYPEIEPVIVNADIEKVKGVSGNVLESMKLEILAAGPGSETSSWTIEAVDTSFWFGFKDDFIVRLRTLEDGSTRVDIRSKSRVGASDLGANAARINKFIEGLKSGL